MAAITRLAERVRANLWHAGLRWYRWRYWTSRCPHLDVVPCPCCPPDNGCATAQHCARPVGRWRYTLHGHCGQH